MRGMIWYIEDLWFNPMGIHRGCCCNNNNFNEKLIKHIILSRNAFFRFFDGISGIFYFYTGHEKNASFSV
jgi:hypothetical protein